jgi:hypothetical protein
VLMSCSEAAAMSDQIPQNGTFDLHPQDTIPQAARPDQGKWAHSRLWKITLSGTIGLFGRGAIEPVRNT